MGFVDWVTGVLGKSKDGTTIKIADNFHSCPLSIEVAYRMLALETCISLIANVLATCEFQTFDNGEKIKGSNYYLLNVRPNQNQSAGKFMHKLVSKLIRNNKCLVIMHNDMLYIADSYNMSEYALYENLYKNIRIGDFTFTERVFSEKDVLSFELSDKSISEVLNALYDSYGKLLASAQSIYKRKNGTRVALNLDAFRPQDKESQEALQDLFDNQLENWFDPDTPAAVLPIPKGLSMQDVSEKNSSLNHASTTRDIRALVDDIFDFTATGLHIPKGLAKGDTVSTGDQIDSFIITCIKPLVQIIKTELNAKLYSKEDYIAKSYVNVDISKIRITDIGHIATAADKLFAAGINTINDNLEMLDREVIDEKWAKMRWITKNYESVTNLSKEGGELDGGDTENQEKA